MPLLEAVGNVGAALFRQSAAMGSNVGVTAGVTVISMLTGEAHCPASGIKV